MTHFRESIDDDHNSRITAGVRKLGYKVNGNILPTAIGNRERTEETVIGLAGSFRSLAYVATSYVSSYGVVNPRPIVETGEKLERFRTARIAASRRVVD